MKILEVFKVDFWFLNGIRRPVGAICFWNHILNNKEFNLR